MSAIRGWRAGRPARGGDVLGTSTADFVEQFRRDIEKWKRVIVEANIQVDCVSSGDAFAPEVSVSSVHSSSLAWEC